MEIKLRTGITVTRDEVIEGLREVYADLTDHERRLDCTHVGYPDYEAMLDYIEQHGLPPKEQNGN
jgi:hypothetical protein